MLCRRSNSSRLVDINFFRTSLARHETKEGGVECPPPAPFQLFMRFSSGRLGSYLNSSDPRSWDLKPETCPRYCCVDSVIRPFSNPHTPTMSLCLPRFWLCTFVSVLTSRSACPRRSLLLNFVAFHPRSAPLPTPSGSQASACPSGRCNSKYLPR
jgi:hypothetical protein